MAKRGAEIRFGRAITGDLAQAERREWWVTNGLGGYASGTIAGSLTRRYHGLLIAPVDPPLGRRLLLAKADATLLTENTTVPLFTNRWASGQIAPAGHIHIESFALDHAIPVWTWRAGGRLIEARIWMEPGANTVYTAWRLDAGSDPGPSLQITLLANNRDHHGLTEPDHFTPLLQALGDRMQVIDGERCTLTLAASGGRFETARTWYRDFNLPIERERGLDPADQHLHVATLRLPLPPGQWCGLVASLDQNASPDIAAALQRRLAHDRTILAAAPTTGWTSQLALAADAFLFRRPHAGPGDGTSVIAGYPWFGDWGRDSMISLPGLCLATGRPDRALDILRTFAGFVSQGMLPNVFPGVGDTPDYNTADASLWFFEAWRAYLHHTGDHAALIEVYPVLADMIAWHQRGTRYGIGVDPADGLLRAGQPGVQLTWMDAKVADWVVTPRIGKPVEINALWYNALCIMADFAARLGEPDSYTEAAAAAQRGFARFLRPDGEGLFDVIDGPEGTDPSIRPNQIFAVSLPHSPLSQPHQANVVRVCRRDLLTTYGLRSLAPGSTDYHPTYGGGVWDRDGAYHQGTVWGWLLGPFALAVHRVTGDKAAARLLLEPMREALQDAAIGTLGEIFDADPPHHPRGAPAQAWTVACTLDAWRQLEQPEDMS
jgi:4-alpha-glucanotransferase